MIVRHCASFAHDFFESDMDRQILGQTLRDAGDSGLLGDDEDLVDSFMVAGAAARQGTFALIRQGIRLVQRQLQQEGLAFPVLRRDDYDTGRKASIAWQNPKARHDFEHETASSGPNG